MAERSERERQERLAQLERRYSSGYGSGQGSSRNEESQRPAYQAPRQAPQQQAPAYQEPRQAPQQQAPAYQSPQPTRQTSQESAPSYQAPRQQYQEQAPAYQEPRQQYQESRQQYQEPRQQYQEPRQQYPAPRYQETRRDYDDEPRRSRGGRGGRGGDNSGLKTTTYVLAGIAAFLGVVLLYVYIQRTQLVKQLRSEKDDLTEQMVALQNDYATLSSDYESINSQLDSSREEVSQLIEKIKKTDATNRRKIHQYEKELGTLRSIMKSYIGQIDSLNTLNKKLTADAAAARKEAAESKRHSEALSKTVENLTGQVAAGSVIKARGLRIEAYAANDKVTDRSSRTTRLLTSLSLIENELAPRGPIRIYIRVKDPSGILLTNGNQKTFECNGEPMIASASREVDYEGAEVDLSIYLNDIPSYVKGVYTVEAYTEKGRLGSAELLLR